MKKVLMIITAALLMLLPIRIHAETISVSSDDLINHAQQLDGQTVTYTGEAVGSIMQRDGYAWVNLNDGSNAVGIVISQDMAASIQHLGGYGRIGDQVEVTGTFHRACAKHGGDLDIHADSIRIVKNGYTEGEKVNTDYVIWSVILASTAACIAFIVYRKTSMM
jgi:aspartyl/asparaginyl-tRNA synthetase